MKLRINMILQNEDREWISRGIWNRIYRQYPSLLAENADRQGSYKETAKKSEIPLFFSYTFEF